MNTTPLPSTAGAYIKALKIIFIALIAGLVMFAVVAWFLRTTGAFPENFPNVYLFLLFILLFATASIGAGMYVFRKRMQSDPAKVSLADKLSSYRDALIIRYVTTEAPAFFAIIVFLLTGNMVFLGIGLAIIAYFTTLWPSVEKMTGEMNLNPDEKMKLQNPDTPL